MSLSGCRPAVVTSWSSRKRLPALGPRFTTSSADPAGSDSTAPAGASAVVSCTSTCSPESSPPTLGMMLVDSPTRSCDRAAPHCAQKRLPSGLLWPQRVQCTSVSSGAVGSAASQVTGRGRPADDGPVSPSWVGRRGVTAGRGSWNQPVDPRVNRTYRVRVGPRLSSGTRALGRGPSAEHSERDPVATPGGLLAQDASTSAWYAPASRRPAVG